MIKVLKIRKDTDYSRLDTVALKLSGGPYNTLFQDIIKYPNYFIPLFYVSNYTFWVHRTSEINKTPVFVIRFKQKEDLDEPLFFGELFIDGKNKVLLSANYSLNVTNREKSSKLFVAKKPKKADVWPTKANFRVDYTEKDGKWYVTIRNNTPDLSLRGVSEAEFITITLAESFNGSRFELDHIIPKSKNGETTLENAELTTKEYNRKKRAQLLFESK